MEKGRREWKVIITSFEVKILNKTTAINRLSLLPSSSVQLPH
ncbi:hypothetical protein [Chryseobacterium viscerum]|nr:hypothetical protein [Chryseobacterium viscerum]MCW1962751.1 hypothetical protein [Chryseobacterium viscerum]